LAKSAELKRILKKIEPPAMNKGKGHKRPSKQGITKKAEKHH